MAHDHSHDHFHSESERTEYYVEQLCTIAACGSLAVVCILMWWTGLLNYILAPQFRPWVPVGGVVLLAVVLVRAAALWNIVGKADAVVTHEAVHKQEHAHDHDHAACDHDHAHGDCGHDHHAHDHDHAHKHDQAHAHGHAHDHGHDHSHAWWPLQIIILGLPIALFLVGLPNSGFGIGRFEDGNRADVGGAKTVVAKDLKNQWKFGELAKGSEREDFRQGYEGSVGEMVGQFMGHSPNECTLIRLKITCCGADAQPLKVRILSETTLDKCVFAANDSPAGMPRQGAWVSVTGQIQFRKVTTEVKEKGELVQRTEYIPVLQLRAANLKPGGDGIRLLNGPPSDEFYEQ